jgi:hypothetical protein
MTLITSKIVREGTLGNEVVILHIKVLLQPGYYVNKTTKSGYGSSINISTVDQYKHDSLIFFGRGSRMKRKYVAH